MANPDPLSTQRALAIHINNQHAPYQGSPQHTLLEAHTEMHRSDAPQRKVHTHMPTSPMLSSSALTAQEGS